jgi:hypothetical protein
VRPVETISADVRTSIGTGDSVTVLASPREPTIASASNVVGDRLSAKSFIVVWPDETTTLSCVPVHPMKRTRSSYFPGRRAMRYVPSDRLIAPVCAPVTKIVAPASGVPTSAAVMVPVTVPTGSCASSACDAPSVASAIADVASTRITPCP